MEGILCWAIDGLLGLYNANEFVEPESSRTTLGEWREEWDSVASFVKDECDRTGSSEHRSLFAAYQEWAKANGYKPFGSKTFTQRLCNLGIEKHRTATWRGFKGVVRKVENDATFEKKFGFGKDGNVVGIFSRNDATPKFFN
jgi:phage/plasmid-associated DNA primase